MRFLRIQKATIDYCHLRLFVLLLNLLRNQKLRNSKMKHKNYEAKKYRNHIKRFALRFNINFLLFAILSFYFDFKKTTTLSFSKSLFLLSINFLLPNFASIILNTTSLFLRFYIDFSCQLLRGTLVYQKHIYIQN